MIMHVHRPFYPLFLRKGVANVGLEARRPVEMLSSTSKQLSRRTQIYREDVTLVDGREWRSRHRGCAHDLMNIP